jgi:hypothetical protein
VPATFLGRPSGPGQHDRRIVRPRGNVAQHMAAYSQGSPGGVEPVIDSVLPLEVGDGLRYTRGSRKAK